MLPHEHQIPQPQWTQPNTKKEVEKVEATGSAEDLGTYSIGDL